MTSYRHYIEMYQQVHRIRLRAKQHGDEQLRQKCNELLPYLKQCATGHLARAVKLVPPATVVHPLPTQPHGQQAA